MGARKRPVANNIKVIRALHQLLARNEMKIPEITEEHFKILANETKIPKKIGVVNQLQPIVKLQIQWDYFNWVFGWIPQLFANYCFSDYTDEYNNQMQTNRQSATTVSNCATVIQSASSFTPKIHADCSVESDIAVSSIQRGRFQCRRNLFDSILSSSDPNQERDCSKK